MEWKAGKPSKKGIPKDLLELSNTIHSIDDARNIISSCHLYLESLLEKIIRLELGTKKTETVCGDRSNLLEKAKILYALGVFNDDTFHDIEVVSNLRNKYSHQLNPKKEKLQNLYSSIRNTRAYDYANKKLGLNHTSDKILFFTMELTKKYQKYKKQKSKSIK